MYNTLYYFSRQGQHPDQALLNLINSAKYTLDIAIYSFTRDEIVKAVIAAKARGVAVRVISDKTQASSIYQENDMANLKAAGIPVKIDNHAGLMHLKITIADKAVVTTGSYNYSKAATFDNDEVLVIMKNRRIAKEWSAIYEDMWNDTDNFTDL